MQVAPSKHLLDILHPSAHRYQLSYPPTSISINGHNSTSYRLLTPTPTLVLLFDVALELASSAHELHRTLTTSSQDTLLCTGPITASQNNTLTWVPPIDLVPTKDPSSTR